MTGGFPANQTVRLSRWVETTNGMGDPVYGYAAPVMVRVVGWAVTGGVERGEDGHLNQVSWDVVLYAPASLAVDAADRFILPGLGLFEVTDSAGNWDTGPWWVPGMSEVRLKKISGGDEDG